MDNFQKLQYSKKSTKPRKHHGQLRKIAKLLRYAEVCVVLVLVSRLSINHLPSTLKNTTECFRNFMGSTRFVFLLGNVIIITLFAQSGHFSNHSSSSSAAKPAPESDLYLEFLQFQNSTIHHKPKPTVTTVLIKGPKLIHHAPKTAETKEKDYRRCQSDIIVKRVETQKLLPPRVLQRCETQKVVSKNYNNVVVNVNSYPEDGMSNDEFRSKVEAFIARQQRLRTTELCN